MSNASQFDKEEGIDTRLPKLIFVGLQLLTVAMALYKCATMSLLPLTSADWVWRLGGLWSRRGASWGPLGLLDAILGCPETQEKRRGNLREGPGTLQGGHGPPGKRSWGSLGPSWEPLEPYWRSFGPSRAPLGSFMGCPGPSCGGRRSLFDRFQRREGRKSVSAKNVRFPIENQ